MGTSKKDRRVPPWKKREAWMERFTGSPSQGHLPKGRRRMLQLPQGESGPIKRTWVDPESLR